MKTDSPISRDAAVLLCAFAFWPVAFTFGCMTVFLAATAALGLIHGDAHSLVFVPLAAVSGWFCAATLRDARALLSGGRS